MAKVTRTIHVRVLAFDPAEGRDIPVPDATILCEDDGTWHDPDLSTGTDVSGADGRAALKLTYDDAGEAALNPFFTIKLPEAKRKVPAGAVPDKTLTLPAKWVTRHYVNRRAADIRRYEDPDKALDLHVGVRASLRVAYSDFHSSGIRNPLALPEDTVGIHLADYDELLAIDWLNRDETLTGKAYDARAGKLVDAGEGNRYPYGDVWPTAPYALGATAPPLRAWVDPPGAPVGQLGGGSFAAAGALAVDTSGCVFMIDGNEVRRFYPDGTLNRTLGPLNGPRALALDQYGNLYVADADAPGSDRIVIFRPGARGDYANPPTDRRGFGTISALAVLPTRVVDAPEQLAIAEVGRIVVRQIEITTVGKAIRRDSAALVTLKPPTTFVPGGAGSIALAAGPGRLFVAESGSHRVTRWRVDAAGIATLEATWGRPGGVAGGGLGEFSTPMALALDAQHGFLYVAETGNNRVQRLDANAGPLGQWTPWPGFVPTGIAADTRGDLYVSDAASVLRASAFDPNTGTPRAAADAPAPVGARWTPRSDPAHMFRPEYVALGAGGRVWVADSGNNRVLSFGRDAAGQLTADPALTGAVFQTPVGVAEDADGNVFVADSGNDRVHSFNPARARVGTFTGGGLTRPRGIAVAQRTEPIVYIADTGNNRVQRMKRDGTFLGPVPVIAFSRPTDVAAGADGRVFVADAGHTRVVELDDKDKLVRNIAVPAVPGVTKPVDLAGVALDRDGKLVLTDRANNTVLRVERDGTLLAWWDLSALLLQDVAGAQIYEPGLARQLQFDAPARAVVDDRGLLCVADTGHDRVRLVRTETAVDVVLLDLDDRLPDISFRAVTKADWTSTLGLKLNVGDLNPLDDSHNVILAPEANFSGDVYERMRVLGPEGEANAAINVMRVVRTSQRWYQTHTRKADANRRWGAPGTSTTVDVDLIGKADASHYAWQVNLRLDSDGRGADAWDDPTIVHEFGHQVFDSARSTLAFPIPGGNHSTSQLTSQRLALSEAWSEYVQLFFGHEYGPVDRVRGFGRDLAGVAEDGKASVHLYGGPDTAAVPAFDAPRLALACEGYIANALYQIHRALVDPDAAFADGPGYWHGFNAHITDARAERFDALLWKPLKMWPTPPSGWGTPATTLFGNILRQARGLGAREGAVVESLLELNNLLTPVLSVSGVPASLKVGTTCTVTVTAKDAAGTQLGDYNLVFAGAPVAFAGAAPVPRHGVHGALERATDATGTVTFTYTAPAVAGTQTLEISYQPDFDTDASFAPPAAGDDRETTLSQAYLYELRTANKAWAGHGKNLGARVVTKVDFKVVP